MKTKILTLITISTLCLLIACAGFLPPSQTIETKNKKGETEKKQEFRGMDPQLIDAAGRYQVITNAADLLKPVSKADTAKNVYFSETGKLAALEIVGRYYLSSGYGQKWISSRDGTVIGSAIPGGSSAPPKQIPGAVYKNGEYYLTEDKYFLVPLAAEDAERAYVRKETRNIILKHINKKFAKEK